MNPRALIRTFNHITRHPFNRGRKFKSVLNYLRWQISSRMALGEILYPWVGGTKLVARPGETAVTLNIYCGISEYAEMAYLLHTLTKDDVFVDVGANVGVYTVLACGARGAKGYCFEPVPAVFERLLMNLRVNGLSSRVTPHNIGVADRDGELAFTAAMGEDNHVLAPGEDRPDAIKVPVRALDSVLAGVLPTVMKIDVEGFEASVLAGAQSALSSASLHSVIVEINECVERYGLTRADIVAAMRVHGFSEFEYDPRTRSLSPLRNTGTHGLNTLFVRDHGQMAARAAMGESFTLSGVTI